MHTLVVIAMVDSKYTQHKQISRILMIFWTYHVENDRRSGRSLRTSWSPGPSRLSCDVMVRRVPDQTYLTADILLMSGGKFRIWREGLQLYIDSISARTVIFVWYHLCLCINCEYFIDLSILSVFIALFVFFCLGLCPLSHFCEMRLFRLLASTESAFQW